MNVYRLELVKPGVVFDSIHVLRLEAQNWQKAIAMAKGLVEIRRANERVLSVRRIYNSHVLKETPVIDTTRASPMFHGERLADIAADLQMTEDSLR